MVRYSSPDVERNHDKTMQPKHLRYCRLLKQMDCFVAIRLGTLNHCWQIICLENKKCFSRRTYLSSEIFREQSSFNTAAFRDGSQCDTDSNGPVTLHATAYHCIGNGA